MCWHPSAVLIPCLSACLLYRVADITHELVGGSGGSGSSRGVSVGSASAGSGAFAAAADGHHHHTVTYKATYGGRDPDPEAGADPGFIMMESSLVLYVRSAPGQQLVCRNEADAG